LAKTAPRPEAGAKTREITASTNKLYGIYTIVYTIETFLSTFRKLRALLSRFPGVHARHCPRAGLCVIDEILLGAIPRYDPFAVYAV
jgi:hypothetical protein